MSGIGIVQAYAEAVALSLCLLPQFVRQFKFERMGCFAYSEEDGTPAAEREDQVPVKTR